MEKTSIDIDNRETLDKISTAIMCFMRGKYRLDEISDGKNELKFRQGKKTILTINIHEDKYTFLIIFGKAEREKFEQERQSFSKHLQDKYDNSKTYHDGKWMYIDVTSLDVLDDIKCLIMIKKKPNRKPFPKEGVVYGKCGHRCDLCIHYTGGTISDEFRKELEERLTRVWNNSDWSMRCSGCGTAGCHTKDELCDPLKCAKAKGHDACVACAEYPCANATAASSKIEAKTVLADDVTWAILPYVPKQYGN
ncbi:MAG: DUF3788 family protein [Bacillota bacterium]|jgi:hypothetical protein